MKAFATLVLLAAVLACTEQAEPPPDQEAAEEIGPAELIPHTLPAPRPDEPRYVGLWATTVEGCEEPAWRFEADRVTTRGEVSCLFQNVGLTPSGYDIQASCTAEAPPAPYRIQLSFAESARAMMIAGGPWSQGTALVYCRPLTPAQ